MGNYFRQVELVYYTTELLWFFFSLLGKNKRFYGVKVKSNQSIAKQKVLVISSAIALFTVIFSHLHYNVIQRGCEAISG